MPITLPTGVHLRGSTFHLRIGVPDDIRHLWPRRKDGSEAFNAFRASLRTSDRNQAAAKAHRIIAEYQDKFDSLRREAAPKTVPLTPRMADHLVREVERRLLEADDLMTVTQSRQEIHDAAGIRVVVDGDENALHVMARLVADQLGEALAFGDLSYAEDCARIELRDLGVVVDLTSTPARMALIRMQRAAIAAWRSIGARALGEPVETPEALPLPPEAVTQPTEAAPAAFQTLRDVVPLWRQRTNAKPNAIERTERGLMLFEDAVGTLPLSALNKGHGAKFVRFLSDAGARGFRANTAKKHASTINALVNVAVKEDLLDRNPFDLSIDTTDDTEDRTPWSAEELTAILASPLFTSQLREFPLWRAVDPNDAKAALLLQLHTGARIGEVAQLRVEDFAVRDEVWTVRFSKEAGTLKTKAAARIVPLANHLMHDPWFADWLSGLKSGPLPALPSLHGRKTTPGDVLGRWFRQFRDSVGLPDGGLQGSHKFRHWLRTELVAQHVAEPVIDQIIGHSAKGSAGRTSYTGTMSMATLKAAIDRVGFPTIASTATPEVSRP